MDEETLTPRQVSDLVHTDEQTVERWIREGWLRATKRDGEWRIRPSDLEVFLDAGEPGAEPEVRAEAGTLERVRDEATGEHPPYP